MYKSNLAVASASRQGITSQSTGALSFSAQTEGAVRVIRVEGAIDRDSAGTFCDTLVTAVRQGNSAVVLDLSDVISINRSGTRGLMVAAKLMQAARRDMRMVAGPGQVRALITHVGHRHLLKLDNTVPEAIARLAVPEARPLRLPGICRML